MMMKKLIGIFALMMVVCSVNCLAQGQITRPSKQTTAPTKPKHPSGARPPIKPGKEPKKDSAKTVVNVSQPDAIYDGHGCVDLGLPSHRKWATCNIGADAPGEIGTFFAWGETRPKSAYTQENSLYYGKSPAGLLGTSNAPMAGTTKQKCLAPEHDAASVNWGAKWRMPTREEFKELIDNCSWKWVESPAGAIVTGPNGKSIFLPADTAPVYKDDPIGHYWTIETAGDPSDNKNARSFLLHYDMRYTSLSNRNVGSTVRPVMR